MLLNIIKYSTYLPFHCPGDKKCEKEGDESQGEGNVLSYRGLYQKDS